MDLMVDLETLATTPRAAIVQIGAAWFSIEDGTIHARFKRNVSIQSSLRAGLEVDHGAIEFWMKQKNASWLYEGVNLHKALTDLRTFIGDAGKEAQVWSHASFDMPILESAYRAVRIETPIHYRRGRDLRTLFYLSGYRCPEIESDTKHDALADCEYQITCCVEAMKKLRGGAS